MRDVRRTESRLGKLYSVLSARERAKLIVRSLKEDTDEDPLVRKTMPSIQAEEFNYYIDLISGVNQRLSAMIAVVCQEAETIFQQVGWLTTLRVFETTRTEVESFLFIHAKEPITESEYAIRRGQAESEMMPLDELAELESEHWDDWRPDDLERTEQGWEVVSNAAWQRVKKERGVALRRLLREGVLQGKRTKRGLCIRADTFYGWRGEAVPVESEAGLRYEVVADSEGEYVERWRRDHQRLMSALGQFQAAAEAGENPVDEKGLAKRLADRIVAETQDSWRDLDACRQIIDEVADEFGGNDPCYPDLRRLLEGTMTKLEDLAAEGWPGSLKPFELPEPREADTERMRQLVVSEA